MIARQWFLVEVTDTFAGDANYCWVRRYLVRARSERGAMIRVGRVSGYRFRSSYASRWDALGACVCAFVEWQDDNDAADAQNRYSLEMIK